MITRSNIHTHSIQLVAISFCRLMIRKIRSDGWKEESFEGFVGVSDEVGIQFFQAVNKITATKSETQL